MTDLGRNVVSTKLFIQILLIVCFIFCFTNAFSQTDRYIDIKTVIFRDGTIISGQVVQMNIDTITIWTPDDDIIVRKFDDVEKLVKWDSAPSRSNTQLDQTPSY